MVRYPSSRVTLGNSPLATFSRGPPASLRFFPPVVFPPRGGTPSRSFTAVGISPIRPSLPLKARSFVTRPALSCTMALWLPTTGFQRSSVRGMPGLPLLHLSPPPVVLLREGVLLASSPPSLRYLSWSKSAGRYPICCSIAAA